MTIIARFRKLTLWNKIGFLGAVAGIIALALAVVWHSSDRRGTDAGTSSTVISQEGSGVNVGVNTGTVNVQNTGTQKALLAPGPAALRPVIPEITRLASEYLSTRGISPATASVEEIVTTVRDGFSEICDVLTPNDAAWLGGCLAQVYYHGGDLRAAEHVLAATPIEGADSSFKFNVHYLRASIARDQMNDAAYEEHIARAKETATTNDQFRRLYYLIARRAMNLTLGDDARAALGKVAEHLDDEAGPQDRLDYESTAGDFYLAIGDFSQARLHYANCVRLCVELEWKDVELRFRVLRDLTRSHQGDGERKIALSQLRSIEQEILSKSTASNAALLYLVLGDVEVREGNKTSGRIALEQSKQRAEAIGDVYMAKDAERRLAELDQAPPPQEPL